MNTCFCTSAHLRFFGSWRRFAAGGGGKPLKRLIVAPPSLNTPLKQGVNESGPESRKNLRCAQFGPALLLLAHSEEAFRSHHLADRLFETVAEAALAHRPTRRAERIL